MKTHCTIVTTLHRSCYYECQMPVPTWKYESWVLFEGLVSVLLNKGMSAKARVSVCSVYRHVIKSRSLCAVHRPMMDNIIVQQ